ncbi:hypothetical protein BJF87_22265 [Gordonia sp. CNJ-863]|nr:hypothetical protein BJF87_22265 [Gordonia sp. CNJ-863]
MQRQRVRLAAVFLAGAFFAGAFFAVVAFFAGLVFFAAAVVVFLAAAVGSAAPRTIARPVRGSFCCPPMMALNWVPGRNAGTERALTLTGSPVRGLRPVRAARRFFSRRRSRRSSPIRPC